jgi:hypothetical protein
LYDDVYYLRQKFPKFDEFPPEKQQALLDMHYNIGSTKFSREYRIKADDKNRGWPSLFDAINGPLGTDRHHKPDWPRAARESNRNDVGPKRNRDTYERFIKGYLPSK